MSPVEAELIRSVPAPSLATSSRSDGVLAEEMASGSFRVKGKTSLKETKQ